MEPSDPTRCTLGELAAAYRRGSLDPVDVTEAFLERIEEGDTYRLVTAARARRQAEAARRRLRSGHDAGPLDGVPIALKDLIDTEGDVTGAGSPPLYERPAADRDAPVAARLDAAGAVFLGKTTMTELAFSGIGINPHTGTPANALVPDRVPGGSSSGSAVAVATGRACAAIGSDTGGSVRIPASFNGLVGLKTTDGLLPLDGCVPLSTTLDTLGPIARTCDDAWAVFSAMAGRPSTPLPEAPARLRLWAPPEPLAMGVVREVGSAFERTLEALAGAGGAVERRPLPALTELDGLYARYGSFAAHEAFARYEELLERSGDRMDGRVVRRIQAARDRPSSDYIRLTLERRRLCGVVWDALGGCDAIVLPTVAVPPPPLERLLRDDDAFLEANLQVLRLTTLGNLLGGPVATVPIGTDADGASIGFSVACRPFEDREALSVARAVARLVGTEGPAPTRAG